MLALSPLYIKNDIKIVNTIINPAQIRGPKHLLATSPSFIPISNPKLYISDYTRYRIVGGITKETKHNTTNKQTPNRRKKPIIESSLNNIIINIIVIIAKNPRPKTKEP